MVYAMFEKCSERSGPIVISDLYRGSIPPSSSSRRFYPEPRDIRNHMNIAANKYRRSKIDQENLEMMINEWRRSNLDDKFHFRRYHSGTAEEAERQQIYDENGNCISEENLVFVFAQLKIIIFLHVINDGSSRLLFVHQTNFQRRMLKRYGNKICLLDATYKTTKYSLPLFFVAVKTNVDYQVVASFVTQDETTAAITEALSIIKSWNPFSDWDWNPTCFMVDNCEEEIQSIQKLFPSCRVLLCDFHREQAWGRWLSATKNGMRQHKKRALEFLRAIARSESNVEFELNFQLVKEDLIWKEENFRNWIERIWLPCLSSLVQSTCGTRLFMVQLKNCQDAVVRTGNEITYHVNTF
ncbi:uncharacterized protein [Clytia hemisphaerica]|uniref:uncharacterized protein n=1 Tax=Clytia hemisphaerica TaxID=252671 RepID=UPI0034D4D308